MSEHATTSHLQNRDARIEALRVFLMLSIFLGHFCDHGLFFKSSSVVQAISISTSYTIGAFAFISGWYSIKFKPRKFLNLLGLGLFYCILLGLITPLVSDRWHFEYSLGWFGNSYLGLMLLAPLINMGIDKLREESFRAPWILWCLYAGLTFVSWLPLHTINIHIMPSGWGSHTVNTLVFFYLTGRIFKNSSFLARITHRTWVSLFALSVIAIAAWAVGGHYFRNNGTFWGWLLVADITHMCPIVFASAVSVFFMFKTIPSERPLRWAVWIAPSVFATYLIHMGCNRVITQWLHTSLETWFAARLGTATLAILANVALSTIVAFVACLLIDLLRRFILVATAKFITFKKSDAKGRAHDT